MTPENNHNQAPEGSSAPRTLNESALNSQPQVVLEKARARYEGKVTERNNSVDELKGKFGLFNPFSHHDVSDSAPINAIKMILGPMVAGPTMALTEGPADVIRLVSSQVGVLREKLRMRKLEKKFGNA